MECSPAWTYHDMGSHSPIIHEDDCPDRSNSEVQANYLSRPLPGWSVTIHCLVNCKTFFVIMAMERFPWKPVRKSCYLTLSRTFLQDHYGSKNHFSVSQVPNGSSEKTIFGCHGNTMVSMVTGVSTIVLYLVPILPAANSSQ